MPKGEFDDEEPLDAAKREFEEETGRKIDGTFIGLNSVRLKSGKILHAFALESDFDCSHIESDTIPLEWPPRSGKMIEIPEVDKATWLTMEEARSMINAGQLPVLMQLEQLLSERK